MVKLIAVGGNEIYQYSFVKVAILNRSTKVQLVT